MNRMVTPILAMILLAGCSNTLRAADEVPSDRLPMYGNVERPEALKRAHEHFIRESTAVFGSRERASDASAVKGWQRYEQDDLAEAMRRFNEAWLLNPHSPQPYWGFGSVLQDQGKVHEAFAMLSRAWELDSSDPRLMADLARAFGLEATLAGSAAEREKYFNKACALFARATALEPKNGHSYGLWAATLYDRGRYTDAWERVHQAQELHAPIPETFLRMLREKMPEPKRP